jgi:hypothetical protein
MMKPIASHNFQPFPILQHMKCFPSRNYGKYGKCLEIMGKRTYG